MRLRGIFVKVRVVNSAAKKLRTIFVVAPCLFMVALLLLPALNGLSLSFEHRGPSFANYKFLFNDSMFWRALANNPLVPIASLVVEFVPRLALARTAPARRARS